MTLSTSLVAERFFEVARAGLQFGEEPRVLDRDDRLVGKGAHQFDLPLGERLHSFPPETNRAENGSLAQQRHPKGGASPGRHDLGHREVRVGADVREMHDPAFERHPPGEGFATGDNGSLAQDRPMLGVRYSRPSARHIAVDLALAYRNPCSIAVAKPGRRFGHSVQHRLHIAGRAADNIEHIAGRGLVLDRLVTLGSAFSKLPLQIGYKLLGIG
jgi:hypothetical protein